MVFPKQTSHIRFYRFPPAVSGRLFHWELRTLKNKMFELSYTCKSLFVSNRNACGDHRQPQANPYCNSRFTIENENHLLIRFLLSTGGICFGTPLGTRTLDTLIKREGLYELERLVWIGLQFSTKKYDHRVDHSDRSDSS